MNKDDIESLVYRMDAEGFHYCFDGYSDWKEIDDPKFQELRVAYLKAAEELESYVKDMEAKFDDEWYEALKPVHCASGYGRIIGSPEGCAVMDGVPSQYFFCTPGGTVLRTGLAWVDDIEEGSEEMEELRHFEKLTRDMGELLYRGPDVLEQARQT